MITMKRIAAVSLVLAGLNHLENNYISVDSFLSGAEYGENAVITGGDFVPRDFCHIQDRASTLLAKEYTDSFAETFGTSAKYATTPTITLNEDGTNYVISDFAFAVQDIPVPEFKSGDLTPEMFDRVYSESLVHAISQLRFMEEADFSGCAMDLSANFRISLYKAMIPVIEGALSDVLDFPNKHPDFEDWERQQLEEMEPLLRDMGRTGPKGFEL